jgi:hypothetical protein
MHRQIAGTKIKVYGICLGGEYLVCGQRSTVSGGKKKVRGVLIDIQGSKAMHNQSEQAFLIRFRALRWNRVDRIATIIDFMNSEPSFLCVNPGDRPQKVAYACKRVCSNWQKIVWSMNNSF